MFLRILIAFVIVCLFAFLYICEKLFRIAFVRSEKLPSDGGGFEKQVAEHADLADQGRAFYEKLPKEDVFIESFDGLRLHGTLLKNGESDRLVISVHGYRSGALHDFAAVLPFLYAQNCNILLIDQRAHGKSEGKYITFGILERRDLHAWMDFAAEKFGKDVQILLHGVSMGATTVLMAPSLTLPKTVRGIVADSGFTSPEAIFTEVLHSAFKMKPFPFLPIVGGMARRRAGFDVSEVTTTDALKNCPVPVLFVHGEADAFVPIRMSEENFAACTSEKKFVRIPCAMHACGYLIEKECCEAELSAFMHKIFK